jgi:type IV pilus assembly protein PilA
VNRWNRSGHEDGFTFIEIIVVSVILVILAGIAIPMFLGQRERAFEAAVIADLRNAGAAQAYLVLGGDDVATTTTELEAVGFSHSDGVSFTNDGDFTAHASGLCIEGTHTALAPRTWRFGSDGDANPREGSCS